MDICEFQAYTFYIVVLGLIGLHSETSTVKQQENKQEQKVMKALGDSMPTIMNKTKDNKMLSECATV